MQNSQISSQGYPGYKLPPRSLVSNFLIAAISAGLIAWAFNLIREQFVSITSEDAVINGTLTEIKAPQAGMISQLTVRTGEGIKIGQPLFTLDNQQVSQLQKQTHQSQLNQQRVQLKQAETQLNQYLALLQTAAIDDDTQYLLENREAQQMTGKVESDLRAARARYRLAELNYNRAQYLKAEGAISQANLDAATLELEQRNAEVDSLEHQLKALQTNQQASRAGLTLSKTRSNSDPRLRLQELKLKIAEQQQTIATLKQRIQDSEAELAQSKTDVKKQQTKVIEAPGEGVVWQLSGQEGKFVQAGESLGQLLDCRKRWVDAFVDEQAVRSLGPGTPATITLYGANSKVLTGRVSTIRPGSGRLTAGEDIAAIPSATNLPRKAQIRVELDTETDQGSKGTFCYVGYTARVNFKID